MNNTDIVIVTEDNPLVLKGPDTFQIGTLVLKAGGQIQITGDVVLQVDTFIKEN